MSKNKAAQRSFWLITTRAHSWKEVLTIDAGGKTVLPVFSFQEEGEFFLGLEATEAHWWTRAATTGELISLLLGLCSRVDKVALDPLPGLGEREIVDLISTSRRHFVRHLMGEVAVYSEHKNPSGPEPGRSDPTRLWEERTRPAQSVARR
ncbi:MAG TPA: hypothetical protein VJ827_13105 [Rubrobacter sp.]|nr:hypothetical protein [Rubrobacter sp.]